MDSKQKIEWLKNLHSMLYSLEMMLNILPTNIRVEDVKNISATQEIIEKLVQIEVDKQKMITS